MKSVPYGEINNNPALAPSRRQAIIWANDALAYAYMRYLASMT